MGKEAKIAFDDLFRGITQRLEEDREGAIIHGENLVRTKKKQAI